MTGFGIDDLDHVMCRVDGVEEAVTSLHRLGFTVTPFSHLDVVAGGNILVCMRPVKRGVANFLEFIWMRDPEQAHAVMQRTLEGAPGPKMLVHHCADPARTRDHLTADGVDVLPMWSIERNWELPDGPALHLSFDVFVPEPGSPPLMVNGYRTSTLEHYLREEFTTHENGALRMTEVIAVVPPRAWTRTVGFFERMYGCTAEGESDDVRFKPAEVALRLLSPARIAVRYEQRLNPSPRSPAFVGVTIVVESLDATSELLSMRGVPSDRGEGRLIISPQHACGLFLEFAESG